MKKRIFILDGHPGKNSLCGALASEYTLGAKNKNHDTRTMQLSQMKFDPDLGDGYLSDKPLEPCLKEFQDNLSWCNHLVVSHPLWWGFMPAKLKGLIDRTFLPGYAYAYKENVSIPEKLLKGRSVELLVTTDTPGWVMNFIYRAGGFRAVRMQIFEFSGIKPVKFHMFSPVRTANDKKRAKWLEKARHLGSAA